MKLTWRRINRQRKSGVGSARKLVISQGRQRWLLVPAVAGPRTPPRHRKSRPVRDPARLEIPIPMLLTTETVEEWTIAPVACTPVSLGNRTSYLRNTLRSKPVSSRPLWRRFAAPGQKRSVNCLLHVTLPNNCRSMTPWRSCRGPKFMPARFSVAFRAYARYLRNQRPL